jgi:hypothetical protein
MQQQHVSLRLNLKINQMRKIDLVFDVVLYEQLRLVLRIIRSEKL